MSTPQPQSGASSSNSLPVGYKLDEYVIVAVLGHGGFGITYRARDTKLGVDVAIKEYFPDVYASRTDASTIVPRPGADLVNYQWGLGEFLKEAQALAKFKHPHIVRVLRFLEANGTAYMIMEYEQGETLSSYLRKHGGVLDEAGLMRLFLPVLSGLQAVHDAGLLHLDIKPDNIYLRSNDQPMLIDFGSSRQMRGEESQKITLTPGYCALEQYPGHGEIGAWSDVYGIGATLYRCITGKGPTDALERLQTFERTRIDPLRPAVSFDRPFYSAHIRQCIDQALKLSAGERPASPFILQQGLMGKDMTQVAKPARQTLYRPGTGFIGVVLPAEAKKKRRLRRGFLEKLIALIVFITTFLIITPKIMIDTGQVTQEELYQWIDDAPNEMVSWLTEVGHQINERVFFERRRPKARTGNLPAPTVSQAETVSTDTPIDVTPPPFGTDKQRHIDITLTEHALRSIGLLKHGAVVIAALDDGSVRLWDAQTGETRAIIPVQVPNASTLAIYPSSQWFAAPNREHAILVFDPLGNRELMLTNDPPHPITAMVVSPNNRLLAEINEIGVVSLWELSQARKINTLMAEGPVAQSLAFSPDERLLVTADKGGALTMWDIANGKPMAHWRAHRRDISAIAFSPDGKWLATAAGDELKMWPIGEEASLERTLTGNPPDIHSITFSPDGRWLLAAGKTNSVYVWNIDNDALAHKIATDDRVLRAFTMTRDGKLIAAAGDDHVIRLWK